MINELRLGNKVLRKNSNDEWRETTVNLTYMGLIYEFPEDYKPIPLTKDWLLNFGFNISIRQRWEHPNINFSSFYIFGVGSFYMPYITPQVKYVHQLQNIFYYITQTELSLLP